MEKTKTITVHKQGPLATITLNRPEVRNAMNLQMVREITGSLKELNSNRGTRLIRITSSTGPFCAGADLAWMKSGLELPGEQLRAESLELAKMFRMLGESEAITFCTVGGRIPGGGIGLLAASDLVVAERNTVLTFSEVKLGLVPATIAPYVLRKAGLGRASDWMMTGRMVNAREAMEAGLIHRLCDEGSLEEAAGLLTTELLSGGTHALKGVKRLLRDLEHFHEPGRIDEFTSDLIARYRTSPEAQEGMSAFLEKRKPAWDEED